MSTGERVTFTDLCYGNDPHNGQIGTVTIRDRDEAVIKFDDGQTVWAMNKEMVTAL